MNRTSKLNFSNYDAAYFADPSNLFYLTGYKNEDARIIVAKNLRFYISDNRVKEEFEDKCPDFSFVDIGPGGGYASKSIEILHQLKAKHIAYEDLSFLHKEYVLLKKFVMFPISTEMEEIRAIKDETEIFLIQSAQNITDTVFSKLLGQIRIGVSELEIQCFINSQIFSMGGSLAFDTIVAFGKNTSKPHAHPCNNLLKENDVITVDFGAKFNGYCSDMTRSFAIGKPDRDYILLYNHVLKAQIMALDNIKAGMTGLECDAISRNSFAENNLDVFFTHSLGHSLGIDIHEKPMLSKYYKGVINSNVVSSVEPGLYIPGKYGIRIEDIVVFSKDGVRNLTKSPKELIIL